MDNKKINTIDILKHLMIKERKEIKYDENTKKMIYNEAVSDNKELNLYR